jgi:hypothetical protein
MAWLGAMPQGVMQAGLIGAQPGWAASPREPTDPFMWGAGGARMRPEDIARQREMAAQMQMAGADTSPVGHWTQGLARVAQALSGHVREKQANKAAEGLSARDAAIAEALLGGGSDVAMRAMLDPYASQGTRGAAKMIWDQANQKPPTPTETERMMIASGLTPGSPEWRAANQRLLEGKTDPLIAATLPGGRFYSGPQSGLASLMGGGGQASTGPMAQPSPSAGSSGTGPQPGAVVDGYRFKGGDPNSPSSWEQVGGPTPSASGGFPGR